MSLHRFILVFVGCACLIAASGDAQEKNARLHDLVAKFPTPAKKDGKLAEVDKTATDAAIAEFLQDADGSIIGLVGMLSTKNDDTQTRQAIHAIVMRVGNEKEAAARQAVAKALATTLASERPKEILGFVVRQLQLIGDEKQAAAIGKLLLDEELSQTAAQALLAIKVDVADQFRAALPKATPKQRPVLVQGLGILKDKTSAEALRKLLGDDDRDTRLTAAWALANLPDASAAEPLLKLADAAEGYERNNATNSCFLLADNLLAAGDKAAARQIYTRLHDSRTEKTERYVKDAAAKGLAAAK